MKLYKMIEIYLKYDNMHTFGVINAFICINKHVNSCIISMLSIPWNRLEVLFHKISFSPISIIDSSSDLMKSKRSSETSLIPCGFDPHLPLYPSIQDIFH